MEVIHSALGCGRRRGAGPSCHTGSILPASDFLRRACELASQAVALGAAVQAGILQGDVADVMVMDIWQAGLMRAFATQQLRDALSSADEAAFPDADPFGASQSSATDTDSPMDARESSADELTAAMRDEEEWGPPDMDSLQLIE